MPVIQTRSEKLKPGARVAVWGHYHGGNLGDELVVDTIVEAIRRRVPDARILGISMSPGDTSERHGIEAHPINPGSRAARPGAASASPARKTSGARSTLRTLARRIPGARRLLGLPGRLRALPLEPPFLRDSYRLLRGVDLVVVAGSGQLLDEWRGPWLHPYTTFRWAVLARMARVPMVYLSVGAGPIESRLSAFFIKTAVASASGISVRDGHSAKVLAATGLSTDFPVCPDIGYGLSEEVIRDAVPARSARGTGTIVGLNPMSHQDPRYWPRGDGRRYDAYLRKLAAFTRWLLDYGFTVRLFSSQPRSDGRVAGDLVRLLTQSGDLDPQRFQSAIEEIGGVRDLVGVVGGCDLIVAARYHSVLLPLLLNIPVLGLAYNPKTTELLSGVGDPDRCFDIDSFGVESLIAAFQELAREERPEAGEARRARVAAHRAAVEEQFDRVFGRADARERLGAEAAAP